jgi:DNA repair protein RadC
MDDSKKSIKHWSEQDQPREKLMAHGVLALSDSELLAILISTGTHHLSAIDVARNLLAVIGPDIHDIHKMSLKDLCKIKGIGSAKAVTILAALELGRRSSISLPGREPIRNSKMGAALFDQIKYLDHEEFWVACLNVKLIPVHVARVHIGGLSSVITDPRIIFKIALAHNASSIIVAHNHPSSGLKPSPADERVTEKLKTAGDMLDIRLSDHLILSSEGYYSFMDEGMI